jgi:hypothetical protein
MIDEKIFEKLLTPEKNEVEIERRKRNEGDSK